MAKVVVKNDDLNDAMKKFARIMANTRKVAKAHEYYLRPGLKAKEKQKNAAKYNRKHYYK